MSTVKDIVESAIADNPVVIFSKTWCPYSKKAKDLFAQKYPQVKTKIFELDVDPKGDEIQSYLGEKTGQTTVPNVFIDQKHIGGSSDLLALDEKGELNF